MLLQSLYEDKKIVFSDVYSLSGVLGAGAFGIVLAVRPKTISEQAATNAAVMALDLWTPGFE